MKPCPRGLKVVAWGYRSNEVASLGNVYEYDTKVRIVKVRPDMEQMQVPEMVSLGIHFEGVCLPHVDTRDAETLADGVKFRMGKAMPERREGFLDELKKTTSEWVTMKMQQLPHDADASFDTWIEGTNYSKTRKEELRKIYEEVIFPLERDKGELKNFKVKLFAKDETYVDFKHARGIYAREDVAKVYFGPWFKMIENEIYKDPTFIKHIPVSERGAYIYDRLYRDGQVYVQTDYSSYESHFDLDLMEHCEFILYDYMLQKVDGGPSVLKTMREVLQGENRVKNRRLTATVEACRMSGEMNTSLGNGFSNYMLMLNECNRMKVECVGVVEGDDGLFVFRPDQKPSTSDFTVNGCIIKLEVFEKISHASFCGLLFDECDMQIVADVRKLMAGLGWSTKQYVRAKKSKHMALIRCKAISMLVQYPACPMVAELSRAIVRLTNHVDVRSVVEGIQDNWTREKLIYGLKNFKHNINEEVGLGTRLLVFDLWGFDLELQSRLEKEFSQLTELRPISTDGYRELFPSSWSTYWDNYVDEVDDSNLLSRHYMQRII